ncbi:BamA/TamA family outer membrane protein [Luteolibacter pohnpeiensis]|uniref:BamA/TamA family outer membrane protein n=1 Tax=Luteolibacter pohnpeiensis TaxID=454153 RepID=A0A934VTC0_9BACT|nr:BamA/TamA family outer membrane protein [Luteolibacter pohnpeiensis]MBK1881332.1 BamA/TamA family outer membrane protein [Luteolibacter pohnpeiensis]
MIKFYPTLLLLIGLVSSVWGETTVHIVGSKVKSESELLGLIGGRLEHVRSKPASASRANDAAFLLTEVMQKDGYASVEVTPKVVSSSEILLTVREGERLSLGDVSVEGVDEEVDTGRLEGLFGNPAEKARPLGSGSAPFREEDVGKGLSLIEQDLDAAGYWGSTATLTNRETSKTGEVSVAVHVDQGPLYMIGEPTVVSTDGRGVVRTRTTAEPFIGKPATTANLNKLRAAVSEAFISRGYPDAIVRMGRTLQPAKFIPNFEIDLGTRVKLLNVEVEGLESTDPERVIARVRPLEGDWYDEAAMNKRLRQLLATGAFSSVRLERKEVSPKRIDATLHIEEAKAKEVNLGVGFGSYEGGIFRANYTDRNLWGQLVSFSSGFEFSSRGILGETKLTNPWLFGSDYSVSPRVYALAYTHDGYSAVETGLGVTFSRTFFDHYKLDLTFGNSLVNISSDGLDRTDLGETVYTHPKVNFTQTLDYRDNPVLPKTGWHLQMPLELGAAVGDESTGYFKTGLSGGWYHPLGKDYEFSFGGDFGLIVPSGDSANLPIDLRLFNGGARSVRSFPERELGPFGKGGNPLGGEASWVTSAEVSRKLVGPVRGVAFMDAGSLSREYEDIMNTDVEVAAGLGLRLDLPIGPVRFEYGYNLTRDEGEPAGAFHFAIGVAF